MDTWKVKPFLKWAGGKTQLIPEIAIRLPFHKNDQFTYIEPFIGSGAVLFWLLGNYSNIKKVVINDINSDLIGVYSSISFNVEELIDILQKWENEYHSLQNDEESKKVYYYHKRELFNSRKSDDIVHAALFIFLNRTCFNGLYRVNKFNYFNVPIGSYKKPLICDKINLRMIAKAINKIVILNTDFEETINYVDGNSFFYLDPPYKPLNHSSKFTSYANVEFKDNEQIRLKEFCDTLHKNGHKWLLSNSDPIGDNGSNNFFDKLYADYTIDRVYAKRSINSNAEKRGKLTELLIRNY